MAKKNPDNYRVTINGYPLDGVVEWDEEAGTVLVNLSDGTQETKSGSVKARLLTEIAAENKAAAEAVAKRKADEKAAAGEAQEEPASTKAVK